MSSRLGVRSVRGKYTSPYASAEHNVGNYALRVAAHGMAFKKAVEVGDMSLAANQASHLIQFATQAASAGNLLLNAGQIVAAVIAAEERKLEERRELARVFADENIIRADMLDEVEAFPFTDADRQEWERLEWEAERGEEEENVYLMMREEYGQ